ncbi:MAG: histidyl-tRNA synthetase [Eubacteriaceae bacterium]|nr:histidyl-tRNA synthetase [Eubacteriaceae bacterium]
MISSNPVRGTRDILPQEMVLRDQLEAMILKRYRSQGFNRIETPVMENLELLLGSDGGENLKMLFSIIKRGEKLNLTPEASVSDLCDLGLRFDLTLPLSRFYANNQAELEMPFKAIQIGNVFRAERPQKGRFRSFKQCDIDIIGDPSVNAEIELIDTTAKALMDMGFCGFTVKINHRKLLSEVIRKLGFSEEAVGTVCITLDKLDKIGSEGVEKELLSKDYDHAMVSGLTKAVTEISTDNLSDWVDDELVIGELTEVIDAVKRLSKNNFTIEFDFSLIRGMGYYTGLIFEVSYGPYGYSIAGGGRYDNMIGKYCKTSVPAVGFSIGFERIVGILQEENNQLTHSQKKMVLFYEAAQGSFDQVIAAGEQWQTQGYGVNLVAMKKKFGKQISAYSEKGYAGFAVFGRDEALKMF